MPDRHQKKEPTTEDILDQKAQENLPLPTDPFKRYVMEVVKYPMLSEKEERHLAQKFHKDGDVEAARALVNAHLRLVVKIALEYRSAYNNILDMIQEGNVGLLQAVKHFNTEKGARLAHYASWWIKSYILKYILDNFRLIKVGTTKTQKRLFYNLMREKERIESMGFKATPEHLSKKLDAPAEEVIEMQKRLSAPELALESKVGKDHEFLLQDFLAHDDKPVDEKLAETQSHDLLKEKLDEFALSLNEKELKIFKDRLLADLPKTLQEIADEYGISKERVRQIEERIINKLRSYFKEKGLEIDLMPTE